MPSAVPARLGPQWVSVSIGTHPKDPSHHEGARKPQSYVPLIPAALLGGCQDPLMLPKPVLGLAEVSHRHTVQLSYPAFPSATSGEIWVAPGRNAPSEQTPSYKGLSFLGELSEKRKKKPGGRATYFTRVTRDT